jgi:glycosyltransferase involved in cell wall biosynthesis
MIIYNISMERDNGKKLKVLLLEPYYGGSHKSFINSLRELPFDFELMTLPARKWKWRMRLAAPYFAEKLYKTNRSFDRIVCSSFVDVAAFRGMAPLWVREVPLLTYFHENQLSYPVQVKDERDFHFALTNITSALASDSNAFNSSYNLNSFLEEMENLLKFSHDLRLDNPGEIIREKSIILPPAMNFSMIDSSDEPDRGGSAIILWNHRWEHDKNPDLFFRTLFELDRKGIDFRLVVLGQSYERQPRVFSEARKRLADKVLTFGYADSRRDYARWLRKADMVVSTATHEFFGMSVLEAVRAGCRPLLPRRLSYPEIFPDEFLYEEEDFTERLSQDIISKARLSNKQAIELTGRYSTDSLAPVYKKWISGAQVLN